MSMHPNIVRERLKGTRVHRNSLIAAHSFEDMVLEAIMTLVTLCGGEIIQTSSADISTLTTCR